MIPSSLEVNYPNSPSGPVKEEFRKSGIPSMNDPSKSERPTFRSVLHAATRMIAISALHDHHYFDAGMIFVAIAAMRIFDLLIDCIANRLNGNSS
jgi:hypothetical protein